MTTSKSLLQVIVFSTRPGRVGGAIGQWFYDLALAHGGFDVELVDLAAVNLPLLDEPEQPVHRQYVHEHTKRWSATISRADAFAFVIPEYNHSLSASTKNAIDFLHHEWRCKPYGIVCYGGVSQGLRAAAMLKPTMAALRMMLCGDVSIPLASVPVVEGVFSGNDRLVDSSTRLLDELAVFAPLLKPLRA